MKTDEEIEGLFALASKLKKKDDGSPEELDSAVPEWTEMKMNGSNTTGWF